MGLKEELDKLSKFGDMFENDPGEPQDIPLEVQFEDCRALGTSLEKLRQTDPEFAAKYEAYLKDHPDPPTDRIGQ